MVKVLRVAASLLALALCVSAKAQPLTGKESPIETTKRVADKMIRTTGFAYKLVPQKQSASLDGVKFLNIGRTFTAKTPAVAYLISAIHSPTDTTAWFEISHSYGMTIWANGSVAYEKSSNEKVWIKYRERAMDLKDSFAVRLKKGANQILVKSETAGDEWLLYLRTKRGWRDAKLSPAFLPNVDSSVGKLSNWLVIGPFPNPTVNGNRTGLQKSYEPERGFKTGKLYWHNGEPLAWTIPKLELTVAGEGTQGMWPGDHNFSWNYHGGGTAWAMGYLGAYTSDERYSNYAKAYTNFFLDKKPFLGFQKYALGEMGYGDAKIAETYMLDFTAAPALTFVYQLEQNNALPNRKAYQDFYNEVKRYTVHEQVRLPEGNFTRHTPHRLTTWADDMFMGIPFLVHASLLATTPAEKKALMDDAVNQIFAFNKQVWDSEYNLYRQTQYSDRKVKIPFWSRANGWGIWAVTEVLHYLPKTHPRYAALLTHYKAHVDGLLKYQNRETGFWHNLIDKPDSYQETSGTAIFAMAMARGINNGWLNRKKYEPFAIKAWGAVASAVDADGTLHGTCIGTNMSENEKDYYTRPVADDDTHGIFPVIFAGMEVDKMMKGGR